MKNSFERLSRQNAMIKEEFQLGTEFYTAAEKWRCTDIGTRVIVAIKLDQTDKSWYNGPPYAVAESVFDEYDFSGCSLDPAEFIQCNHEEEQV